MRARDVMEPARTVRPEAEATEAARILADPEVRGVLLVAASGRLAGVVTDSMLLRSLLPTYVTEAEVLAGVLEEAAADALWRRLGGRTAADLVPEDDDQSAAGVDVDATLVEVASAMVASRLSLVAVLQEGRVVGAIGLNTLLKRLLVP